MNTFKALGATFIFALATQLVIAQPGNVKADSIKYFLLHAVEKKDPAASNSTNGHRDPKSFGIELQSQYATLYSPAKATVLSTFDIDGAYAVLLQFDKKAFITLSDLKSTQLKKGDIVERGTILGEAGWNETTKQYECGLVLSRQKKATDREILEQFLNRMK